jgi:ComF family protein
MSFFSFLIHSIKHDLLETIYPTLCPGCGALTDENHIWCSKCMKRMWNPRLINSSQSRYLKGCYTLCFYNEPIRKCIIQLKYNDRTERKRAFPSLLNKFPYWERLKEYDIVIPIPLSKKKMRLRGYNQVDLIFEKWMKRQGKTYLPDGLKRIRTAQTQSLLSREERQQNTKGVFWINHNYDITGKKILIVDDIYTTGATMNAAAEELIRAGAKEVFGLTIASGAW